MAQTPRRSWLLAGVAALVSGLVLCGCGSVRVSTSSARTTTISRARQLLSAGLGAQTQHDSVRAVTDFLASLALDPSDVYAAYDLGIAQMSLGRASQAATAYREAIRVNPTFAPALFNLADLLTSTAPNTAIGLFEKLEKLDPKDANVAFNLGLLLESQGHLTEGEAQLKAALSSNPALKSRLPKGTQLSPGSP